MNIIVNAKWKKRKKRMNIIVELKLESMIKLIDYRVGCERCKIITGYFMLTILNKIGWIAYHYSKAVKRESHWDEKNLFDNKSLTVMNHWCKRKKLQT